MFCVSFNSFSQKVNYSDLIGKIWETGIVEKEGFDFKDSSHFIYYFGYGDDLQQFLLSYSLDTSYTPTLLHYEILKGKKLTLTESYAFIKISKEHGLELYSLSNNQPKKKQCKENAPIALALSRKLE